MTLSIAVHDNSDTFAASIATQVREQHALQEFTNVDALSLWIRKTLNNPRISIVINEAGSQIDVRMKNSAKTRLLTINVF